MNNDVIDEFHEEFVQLDPLDIFNDEPSDLNKLFKSIIIVMCCGILLSKLPAFFLQ